ncbi:unnamed protein product [Pleuronectes platessa]|uniref:Uncharacterized protein n=1 Tax=Pleuronectes platessa TaxID=8262 RepID=A0A9N7V5I8_PLEPL|nr:unnamed protein product [Pleuronectes platessa]
MDYHWTLDHSLPWRPGSQPTLQTKRGTVGPEPSGGPPDTEAERNKGLLNFGRETSSCRLKNLPLVKREIHSAEEHELHIPEEEGRRSSHRSSTSKSAVCPVQRPKTA